MTGHDALVVIAADVWEPKEHYVENWDKDEIYGIKYIQNIAIMPGP